MKTLKNKTIAIAIAIFLMFSMSASMMLVPSASAHTPTWNVPTYAYVAVFPNPIGTGQTTYIDMWIDHVIDGAALGNDIRFHNYELTITAPDGTITTQTFATVSDPTSNLDYSFTPTQVGTYTFNFTFPGQKYTYTDLLPAGFFAPPGTPPALSAYYNDTYLASTASTTLTVQQTAIPAYPTTPLPTEYWTRPIYGQNPNWWSISSNWLGTGSPGYSSGMLGASFPGDAVGPQTSHVMWTKPLDSGGVVGGNNFAIQGDTNFEGSAYNNRFNNPIIINGYLYYTEPISFAGANSGPTDCVNLQTGQLVWSRSDVPALSFGYIYDVQDPNQHGVYPPILIAAIGSYFFSPSGFTVSTTWRAFDAYTGDPMFNITNVPSGTILMGPEGEYLILSLTNDAAFGSPPQYYLSEWNSSRLWDNQYSGSSTSPSVIPPIINGADPSLIDWNYSVPSLNTLSATPSIESAFYNNMMIVEAGAYPSAGDNAFGSPSWTPYTYLGINLNQKSTIGNLLWTNTVNPPTGNVTISYSGADQTVGVFTEYNTQTMAYVGYSMSTGKQIWGPTPSQAALDFFSTGYSGQGATVAYGKLYNGGYGGIVYCYDLTNGHLLWTYGNGGEGNSTNGGLQLPRPYPTIIYAIGNGVVYTVTSEHTVSSPIYKGALARAINATDGTEIWTLSDDDNGGTPTAAIADGFATFFNGYDNQIYSVGRGPSDTTVQAPLTQITAGNKVVIQGTVMDISAGTKQTQQAADFPNGVPVASDASMKDWMSYVYQQQPCPTNFTGATVSIDAIDPNSNLIHIGDATSNANGLFYYTWTTPNIPGDYLVTATFAGTNGYWPSNAQTAMTVQQAPSVTPTATPQSNLATTTDLMTYMVAGVIAIIIAIAIVGFLIIRKHP
jgi:hypothetical protein